MVISSAPINHIGYVYIVLHPPSKQNFLSHCFINCGRTGNRIRAFFYHRSHTEHFVVTAAHAPVIKRVGSNIEQVFIAYCQIRLAFLQGGSMCHKTRQNSHRACFYRCLPNRGCVCPSKTGASRKAFRYEVNFAVAVQ